MHQLFLIGPMGVGKTTIGKKIAKKLGVEFRDTDKLIVAEHGSIPVLFEQFGEDHFRKLETQALLEQQGFEGVVATGGGIVLAEANREFLSGRKVVYLSTKGNQMKTRMLSSRKRPLLKNGYQDWKRIYSERKPLYESVCSDEVSIDDRSLTAVAEQCVEIFRRQDA
jgi:shikimate kinase